MSSGHPYRIVENLIRTGSLIDFYRRRKGKREERRFTFRLVFKKIQSRFKKEKKEKVSSSHSYRIVENLNRTGRKTQDVRLIFVEEKKEKNKATIEMVGKLVSGKVASRKRVRRQLSDDGSYSSRLIGFH